MTVARAAGVTVMKTVVGWGIGQVPKPDPPSGEEPGPQPDPVPEEEPVPGDEPVLGEEPVPGLLPPPEVSGLSRRLKVSLSLVGMLPLDILQSEVLSTGQKAISLTGCCIADRMTVLRGQWPRGGPEGR
jgi:hypothetical protein